MKTYEEYLTKMLAIKPMKYEELSKLVINWGEDKGIFAKSNPLRQLDKTQEELDETKSALTKLNDLDYQLEFMQETGFPHQSKEEILEEVEDGIGDMLVTIILLAKMVNMDAVDCLNSAYDVIKKRTGKMVNGLFVKD